MNQTELEQEIKRCPRYVQVAYELCRYLIDQKNRIPAKERTGQQAVIALEIQEVCRRFKCSRKTLSKAIVTLEQMHLAYALRPGLSEKKIPAAEPNPLQG